MKTDSDFKTSNILDEYSIYLVHCKPKQYPKATKEVIQSQMNI